MDKASQLQKIAQEIEQCGVCKAGKSGKPVPGEGNPDADIVFVGEAPGKTEAKIGRPFVGRSGELLRSLISEVGLKEEEVFITSPVKYLPGRSARQSPDGSRRLAGGSTPSSQDIVHGREHLVKQLRAIDPKFVVLLGRVAAEGVLQKKVFVIKEHGKIIHEENGRRYFLTLHPAAAIRFQKYRPVIKADFEILKLLL